MNDPIRPSRRGVFHGLSALGAAGVLIGCGDSGNGDGPGAATDDPQPTDNGANGGGQDGDPLAQTNEVPVGGGLVLPDDNVVITQPTADEFKAFSATCTHQGCAVDRVDDALIHCPCHRSSFSIDDGAPRGGPARAALPEIDIEVDGGSIRLL